MMRPLWQPRGLLQFESGAPGSANLCKNVEWPVRHALTQVRQTGRQAESDLGPSVHFHTGLFLNNMSPSNVFCCVYMVCVRVRQVYRAEREMMRLTGRYTERLEELLNPAFCDSKTKHNTYPPFIGMEVDSVYHDVMLIFKINNVHFCAIYV